MFRCISPSVSALAMSALILCGVSVATITSTVGPAYSKSDNANGRSDNGRSNRNINNERGAPASSLGALNAAHANAMASESTSANSRVGMIELYKAAVFASADAELVVDDANAALALFLASCGSVTADETIVSPTAEECTAQFIAANAELNEGETTTPTDPIGYTDYLAILNADLEAALGVAKGLSDFEKEALELAANKETNDAVIEALWGLLDAVDFESTDIAE